MTFSNDANLEKWIEDLNEIERDIRLNAEHLQSIKAEISRLRKVVRSSQNEEPIC